MENTYPKVNVIPALILVEIAKMPTLVLLVLLA